MKAPYQRPTLQVHGDIRAITAGKASGNLVDADTLAERASKLVGSKQARQRLAEQGIAKEAGTTDESSRTVVDLRDSHFGSSRDAGTPSKGGRPATRSGKLAVKKSPAASKSGAPRQSSRPLQGTPKTLKDIPKGTPQVPKAPPNTSQGFRRPPQGMPQDPQESPKP